MHTHSHGLRVYAGNKMLRSDFNSEYCLRSCLIAFGLDCLCGGRLLVRM